MKGVASLDRVRRVIGILALHDEGLPLDQLAEEFHVSTKQLRADIFEFYALDVSTRDAKSLLIRPEVVEFISPQGEEMDPTEAPWVRLAGDAHLADLPDVPASQAQLATLLAAGTRLAELEPDNMALLIAVGRLKQLLNVELSGDMNPTLVTLQQAIDEQRHVHLTYSRAWNPGVGSRTVEPYQLVHTTRGWELDAGPVIDGHARTFLVQRIRSAMMGSQQETFTRPDGVEDLLARERQPETVELLLPQRSQWIVDRFAESSDITSSDENDYVVLAKFLPPVATRVGLIMAISGPNAAVLQPEQYSNAGRDVAQQLLVHHGLDPHPNDIVER